VVNLREKGWFSFLGFDIRFSKNREGKTYVRKTPRKKKCVEIGKRVKTVLKTNRNKPLPEVIRLSE
jgi:RNA-directed DNA polymerase